MAPLNMSPIQRLLAAIHQVATSIMALVPQPPFAVSFATTPAVAVSGTITTTYNGTQGVKITSSDIGFTLPGSEEANFSQSFCARLS